MQAGKCSEDMLAGLQKGRQIHVNAECKGRNTLFTFTLIGQLQSPTMRGVACAARDNESQQQVVLKFGPTPAAMAAAHMEGLHLSGYYQVRTKVSNPLQDHS